MIKHSARSDVTCRCRSSWKSLLFVDHHEVMYGRWIHYHIMEINIDAQFQPTCCAENDHFVNHNSFAHHSFSKLKMITKWLPAVSMAFSPVRRLLEEMLLLLCCSMIWAATTNGPDKTHLPHISQLSADPFSPLQTLNPKKLPKKKLKKEKNTMKLKPRICLNCTWTFTIFTAFFWGETIWKPQPPNGHPRFFPAPPTGSFAPSDSASDVEYARRPWSTRASSAACQS